MVVTLDVSMPSGWLKYHEYWRVARDEGGGHAMHRWAVGERANIVGAGVAQAACREGPG